MSSTKIVMVGKSSRSNGTSSIGHLLKNIEPDYVPLELLSDVYLYSENRKYKMNKKSLGDPVTIENITRTMQDLHSDEPIERVEIILNLDLIEAEIHKTNNWLESYFV